MNKKKLLKYLKSKKQLVVKGLLALVALRILTIALAIPPYFHVWKATVIFPGENGSKITGPSFYADHVIQYGAMTCFRHLGVNSNACVTDVEFEFVEPVKEAKPE